MHDEVGNDDRGAWTGDQLPVVSGTGVTIGEDLFEGYSWTMGVVLLTTVGLLSCVCVCCVQPAPVNWICTRDKRTRGCTTAKRHDFEKHANQDHQPREREDVQSLRVFWRSAVAAVAADGDVEYTVLSSYLGTAIAAHCHHE